MAAAGRARDVSSPEQALLQYRSAIEEGVLKVLSKMGISCVDSYRGAAIFDAIGLSQDVIDLCFEGTPSPLGGIGFEEVARDVLARHTDAFGDAPAKLANPGLIKFHKGGEYHATNPNVVRALHQTVDPDGEVLKSTQAGDEDELDPTDDAAPAAQAAPANGDEPANDQQRAAH
ncbi:MAG: hypothetical protein E6G68_06555, partial [Actinobacteria bacterium]